MLELVSWNYWWPGLSRYVTKFVAGCDACNWMKTFPTQKVGKLIPNKDLHRHDWRTPGLQGIQCCPHGGGSPVQADSRHPHSHLLGLCRSRPVVPGACLAPPWTSRGSD